MSEHDCIMMEKIDGMEEKIDGMDKKLDKVVDAITGDEMGNPGIINTQKNHDKRISNIESIVLKLNVEKLLESRVEKSIVKKYKLTKKDYSYLTIIGTLLGTIIYTLIDLFSK